MWKDRKQVYDFLWSDFDEAGRAEVGNLFAFHSFLLGMSLSKGAQLNPDFTKVVCISDYGKRLLSSFNTSLYSDVDIAIACALVFYHHDFLIDVGKSNATEAMSMFGNAMSGGSIRLADRFGRMLYDKFNALPKKGRAEYLDAAEVDHLLEGTEQGNYQVEVWASGPFGILRSSESRYLPPVPDVPLWHCSDPGCQSLHDVTLLNHAHPIYAIVQKISNAATAQQGPKSDWESALKGLLRKEAPLQGKPYHDLAALIADALSPNELSALFTDALKGKAGDLIRGRLKQLSIGADLARGSPDAIAASLSSNQKKQLLMVCNDAELVQLLDRAVLQRRIKVPATETRTSNIRPPRLSRHDLRSRLSSLGVRSDRSNPSLFLSASIWTEYQRADQLAELVWRCQMGSATPMPGLPLEYIKVHGPRQAVRNLVLSSRPIALALADKLKLELFENEQEESVVDRFLWKLGFNFARYDQKYNRIRSQLQQLREEAIRAPARLGADDRDAIRSKGVNLFVSMENLVEELVSFSIWLLSSDHLVTRFEYKFEDARSRVAEVLGATKQVGDVTFSWNPKGGNALGVSLLYARSAVDWISNRATSPRSHIRRVDADLPYFVDDPVLHFAFRHYELWADADIAALNEYERQFSAIVTQLERSRLPEIRNGIDHFREEEKFPSLETIVTCERRLSEALEAADLNRLIPKAFWLMDERKDEFGIREFTFQDYNGRKMVVNGPQTVSGLRQPKFSNSWIIPYGNLLGHVNAELLFELKEESPYSTMWANYPNRRGVAMSQQASMPGERSEFIAEGQGE